MAAKRRTAASPDPRTDCSREGLRKAVLDNLFYATGHAQENAARGDWYTAVAYTVRDRMLKAWVQGIERIAADGDVRCVAYLSAEFLIGPQLGANMLALGITEPMREALASLGQDLDAIVFHEPEPGLGNGGLGRLAACFMDSLATLGVPAIGYGIRYEFGMFRQAIEDGAQVELADKWLRRPFPWELPRGGQQYEVRLGGKTHMETAPDGTLRVQWTPAKTVTACAHDIPVVGHGGTHCNLLRLWRAEAVEAFDFSTFNAGEYFSSVHDKIFSETITKVLYPNDDPYQGKQLRLGQQYLFVSASLQDMLHIHHSLGKPLETFHTTFAIQLNDTHPAVAVAELMRLLVDVHGMDWDTAWSVTTQTFAYTNHTLLPEALEKWPLPLFAEVLPRHLEIVYEINRRFLESVTAAHPEDPDLARRLSLIDETSPRFVRMAHLATVGSKAVNGVAALHSELLKRDVLGDLAAFFPEKFTNVTNGVTPRRWLALCNPALAACISNRIGTRWQDHFEEEIIRLEEFADDPDFQAQWQAAKLTNKQRLTHLAKTILRVELDPAALFDVQVKRIHEYKRQHLNVLRVIALYNRLRRNPGMDFVPRAVIFGGKAAPAYYLAKQIILLVNRVAEVVNTDPAVAGRLRVAFVPNFNVRSGQVIYPAADLSQQISLAGKEASGTGNMKFGINGAVTIGTLDGANVEMRACVGEENFFLFGLTTDEVQAVQRAGYSPAAHLEGNPELAEALDQIRSGVFSRGDAGCFRPLVDNLLHRDEYLVLADFASYMDCQDRAARTYADPAAWTRMSILNVARLGMFSSDRSIREYCRNIWNVPVE
ncbi:glycogen/starch/alpha-glucan phosphorylase [Megalodesulfovibrio gigas]|uniref:Alpha-1,4 glucan phosphorylase n=1 Tax=Megalodesulfovibrio gigas (strain ATCC 19364 / DSM 1382 / NCIMB 9332 / VKM B-1759) TaxID=1121448 RepID=T2GET7_MEGG1|nr:glycogen/starch/alpha-glucan phosphorylase [Megalodesulfovibrio gigas]AGW14447.1 putative glycogen/starch/alpha-glucan phosphorylase [Megalodesulfovibrio gigas DSM 1382 = ATCC 19364]